MRTVERALELGLMLRPFVQRQGIRRVLPRIAGVMLLLALMGILGATILLGSLYGLYLYFLQLEWSQLHALFSTLGAATLLLGLSAVILRWRLQRIHKHNLPPLEKVASVFDAFMDGFRKPE